MENVNLSNQPEPLLSTENVSNGEPISNVSGAVQAAAEDKYRTLLNLVDEGFCIFELVYDAQGEAVDWIYQEANPAFEKQTGYLNPVGKRISYFQPNLERSWFGRFSHVARTGESVRFTQYTEAMGIWYDVYALRVGAAGENRVSLLFTDISERKRDELRQAVLLALGDVLRPLSDAVEIQAAVTQMAMEKFETDRCYYCEIENNTAIIGRDASLGDLPSVAGVYPLNKFPLFHKLMNNGVPLVVEDSNTTNLMDDLLKQLCIQMQIISFMNIPVVKQGRYVGNFCVTQSAPRRWSDFDVAMAQEITERTWEAVERTRATAALRESEEKFRAFVLASSDVVYSMSADWQEMRFLKGRDFIADTDEASVDWLQKYIPEADKPQVKKVISEAIRTKSVFALEHRILRVDNTIGWTYSRAVPILDERGKIDQWFGTATDITERKQTEEIAAADLQDTQLLQDLSARLVSEENTQTIYDEIITVAIRLTRADAGTVQIFDAGAEELALLATSGFDPKLTEYFHRVRASSSTSCGIALKTGARVFLNFDENETDEACRMHVEAGYLSAQSTPLVARSGEPIGMLTTHWRASNHRPAPRELRFLDLMARQAADLIEQRRAERVIRESEAQYRTLFDSMDEGYFLAEIIFDADDEPVDIHYLEANPAAVKMTGTELAGKTARELDPNFEAHWFETFGRVAKTGVGERRELTAAPLGAIYSFYVFKVGAAEERKIAAVYQDITERKRREANLALLAEVSQDLARLTNIDDTMNALGAKIGAHLGLSACIFGEIFGENEAQITKITHGWNRANTPGLLGTYQMREFMTLEMIQMCRRAEAIVIRDVFTDPKTDGAQYAAINIGSFIGIPLVRDGEWRFLLVVYRSEPHDWSKDEIALVRELMTRIWTRLERARAEDALHESEARLQAMAANLPGGAAFIVDRDLRYQLAEGEALRAAGLAPSDLVGKTIFETLTPTLAASYEPRLRQALAGADFTQEHEANGTVFLSRGTPLRLASGEIYGVLVVSYDISERKRAEETVRAAEERFRVMVEGAQDYAMFLLDLNSRITFWSKGAERVLGWTEAEVLGQSGVLIFTPEDRVAGAPEREIQTALGDGKATDRRWHLRNDGSRFWADGLLMRLDDANGNPTGFAKVARDATDQKRGEDALENAAQAVAQANAELEARVEERTRELAQTNELRQALLKQLVSAQELERGKIARDLHDDTGQQVTGLLLGLAALKSNSAVVADANAFAAVSAMQQMANDVAQKSHRIALNLRPTALDDIGLMQALKNYTEQWSGWSGVPVALESIGMLDDDDCIKRLDNEIETTIYRVAQEALTNVLRHAVGAPRSDGGRNGARQISILVQCGPRDVLTIIEDDGPGFDVDAALNRPLSERRLGLLGMQERARLAGGTLTIESEPGEGTTLYLRLPLGKG